MKVSLNTVRQFSNVSVDDDLDRLVEKIGAQLGAVEQVEDYRDRYDKIAVAKVIKCEKHPNADKLSVCTIDDGGIIPDVNRDDSGFVQVVCGAPNVREGLIVAWLPPGATVPSTYEKDPFVLDARELRGVISNGMLASASELGISGDHDGLLEIEESDVGEELVRPGTEFKRLYGLDDVVIEIENKMFTHRPDCFGILGVARELAGIYGQAFKSPGWYLDLGENSWEIGESKLDLRVVNELPELVPRFMAVAMDNVEIKPSPIWMQALLTRIGVKPINNVVDITNYLAYATGQPLHAYDYQKVKALSGTTASLMVRHPHDGETISLLNGKTIEPRSEAVMIATDQELIGIGGVMGGNTTEVDDSTTSIIIECANFDMYSIRRTSMAHGLFTDAVTRNTKGQSPLQNAVIMNKAMAMMSELADAKQASDITDNKNEKLLPKGFDDPGQKENESSIFEMYMLSAPPLIDPGFINSRLGINLTDDEICKTLNNVELGAHLAGGQLCVEPPFWRTDIEIAEDVVEEVGRLIGFDKLHLDLPTKKASPSKKDPNLALKQRIRRSLSSLGASEVLSYSFVHGDLISKCGQDTELAFKISNALSPELQFYRLSLTPSLLNFVHPNIKSGHDGFALFELGKVHIKTEIDEEGVPREFGRVAAVLASKTRKTAAYFSARAYLDQLAMGEFTYEKIDVSKLQDHKLMQQMIAPYEIARSAFVCDKSANVIGIVGEYNLKTIKSLKLPEFCAGFEVFLSALKNVKKAGYRPLPRFPGISQDVCLEVDQELEYIELESVISEALELVTPEETLSKYELFDIYTDEKIGQKKRVTFRVTFTSYERTLTEETATGILDKMFAAVQDKITVNRI